MKKPKSKSRHQSLGTFLKDARQEQQLSQWDVAKKLGYSSPQFISNVERGISSPPLKVLKVLMDLYRVPSKDLLEVIANEQMKVLEASMQKIRRALA